MCPWVPDRIGIWKCWFLRRGENQSTRRKTSRSKGENQPQFNPHMASTPGFEPGPHWWEASASHHCATLAPQRAYPGLFFAWNSTTPDFIDYNRKTFIKLNSLQSCINTIICNQNLRQPPGLQSCRSMQLHFIRERPLEKWWGGGGVGKNSCKEEGKEKIHAEGRTNCDFFRTSEFLSECLSFRNQQYYQAQYE